MDVKKIHIVKFNKKRRVKKYQINTRNTLRFSSMHYNQCKTLVDYLRLVFLALFKKYVMKTTLTALRFLINLLFSHFGSRYNKNKMEGRIEVNFNNGKFSSDVHIIIAIFSYFFGKYHFITTLFPLFEGEKCGY